MNMPNNDQFSFNISLSVLNHLGRNLYRSFVTVLGEAISNSWDADAYPTRMKSIAEEHASNVAKATASILESAI